MRVEKESFVCVLIGVTMDSFYLTLSSNDGSIRYFPGNTNSYWKNQLNSRIDLQGDWVVGLSSMSLPHETTHKNRWEPFLKGLKDDEVLLTTIRLQISPQNAFKTSRFLSPMATSKGIH